MQFLIQIGVHTKVREKDFFCLKFEYKHASVDVCPRG